MDRGIDIGTLKLELKDYLIQEEKKHKGNLTGVQKDCKQCGFCCLRQPCVPTPSEFNNIASYLHMTPLELASRYAVVNESEKGLYMLWARETQADVVGKFLPFHRTYDRGYCIFFNKNMHACMIHDVRPRTAKDTKCWEKKKKDFNAVWTVEQVRAVVPNFNPYDGGMYVVDQNGKVAMVFI
ncbi:YkgJ family cysteine cluster protein [Dehalococcoides mccartyi]|nr:YkgJ family cysteine cluster protein [Dehalococcoides mccartyi]